MLATVTAIVICNAFPSNAAFPDRCATRTSRRGHCSHEIDDWSLLQLRGRGAPGEWSLLQLSSREASLPKRAEVPWWEVQDTPSAANLLPGNNDLHAAELFRPSLFSTNATANGTTRAYTNPAVNVRWSLAINGIVIAACVLVFLVGTLACARVYFSNAHIGIGGSRACTCCTCVRDTCALSIGDISQLAGLDQAMLVAYTVFGMKVLIAIGAPMLVIALLMRLSGVDLWDMHGLVEEQPTLQASSSEKRDRSAYWVYASLVWWVTIVTQFLVHCARQEFLPVWTSWVRSRPLQDAATVMVTHIPVSCRTDHALGEYFNNLLRRDAVKSAHIVKNTLDTLLPLWQMLGVSQGNLNRSKRKLEKTGMRPQVSQFGGTQFDSITFYEEQETTIKKNMAIHRGQILKQSRADHPENLQVCSTAGFVTFKKVNDANLVLSLSLDGLSVSIPPQPEDVLFANLAQPRRKVFRMQNFGCIVLGCLFCACLCLMLYIGVFSESAVVGSVIDEFRKAAERTPFIATIWDAAFGVTLLTVVLGLLFPPLFLFIIERMFFLPSSVSEQQTLQTLTFVVLITSLIVFGGAWCFIPAIAGETEASFKDPKTIADVFARRLPESSYVFVCYIITQWSVHFIDMARIWQLSKFVFFRCWYGDVNLAKDRCEPENQGCNGIGFRSSRFTSSLVVTLCLSTLNPFMVVFGLVDFALCRLIYCYLVTFAERYKPDTGGSFYMAQLKHTLYSLFLYVALMTGFLIAAASNVGPGVLAALSVIPLCWSSWRFDRVNNHMGSPTDLQWADADIPKHAFNPRAYVQPEIAEPLGPPRSTSE